MSELKRESMYENERELRIKKQIVRLDAAPDKEIQAQLLKEFIEDVAKLPCFTYLDLYLVRMGKWYQETKQK